MNEITNEWFFIDNINEIDSPALVIYPERIKENIRLLINRVKDIASLRPHVKTNKMAEVCQLMMNEGIQKFKCATIAEAEMLALIKAPDVLLAYQPVGPKVQRLIELIKAYPSTLFSCLIDNVENTHRVNEQCAADNIQLNIFIDLNIGMNRTGIHPGKAIDLFEHCLQLSNISPVGLHAYDGHINDTDSTLRQQKSDAAFMQVENLSKKIEHDFKIQPVIVVGGSPSFATHVLREHVEYSPGTFVFWDWGYKHQLPDEPYQYAALVISRVISIIDEHTICTDLGHKSVAAENPLPRVHFLNAPDAIPVGQSEEHLILKVPDASGYSLGDVLYGVPVHICPTVALDEKAIVIENNRATAAWQVIARNRKISI
jgi:D-serine deaminase-like pyridoxal phosphate-dependent protein